MRMRFRLVLMSALAVCGLPALAQDVRFDFQAAGNMWNQRRGWGVELVFVASALPEGGLDALEGAPQLLCDQFTAEFKEAVRVFVADAEPAYLAVTIRSGGFIGTYLRDYFDYADGGCGALQ